MRWRLVRQCQISEHAFDLRGCQCCRCTKLLAMMWRDRAEYRMFVAWSSPRTSDATAQPQATVVNTAPNRPSPATLRPAAASKRKSSSPLVREGASP